MSCTVKPDLNVSCTSSMAYPRKNYKMTINPDGTLSFEDKEMEEKVKRWEEERRKRLEQENSVPAV